MEPSPKPNKPIKTWNITVGNDVVYIGARSQKEAVELINKVVKTNYSVHSFRQYSSPCWGKTMEGIEPEIGVWIKKGVWALKKTDSILKRII